MTKTNEISKALDNIGAFTSQEKELIAAHGQLVTIPANWAPIAQATNPDKVYLVIEGEAAVMRNREEIGTITAGELMGEMGLASRRARNATVVARTPMTALHFTSDSWAKLQTAVPNLGLSVATTVAARTA